VKGVGEGGGNGGEVVFCGDSRRHFVMILRVEVVMGLVRLRVES
jgi:hypothetical protein